MEDKCLKGIHTASSPSGEEGREMRYEVKNHKSN